MPLVLVLLVLAAPALAAPYDVREKDIATLQADMTAGRVTSVQLVKTYQARIAAIDKAGPRLNSIVALNPDALAEAAALDAERKTKGSRGPLHGIPILIKDNIETADPVPTTAGSLALANNITHRDAPVVARLRAAGAVILGKTNLSEWANIRSRHSFSGWSGIGGLVKNPYALDRSTCGSSAGSGAAVAANLAAAALGTETNGSLVCPGSFNGIVAFKPTVGLVSRNHIVPISHSQDTAGPMTRSVADTATLLAAMAGSDPGDPATTEADMHRQDYAQALPAATLNGKRLGVIVPADDTGTGRVFAAALAALTAAGAEIVPIPDFAQPPGTSADEALVLEFELKHDMNAYLASLPPGRPRTLADLIAFNRAAPRELQLFGQDRFEAAEARGDLSDPAYQAALARLQSGTRSLLDESFTHYRVDALIEPTAEPSFRIDLVRGDSHLGVDSAGVPAIAGYPHLTVPMGAVKGLPVGLSLVGPRWSEATVLALGAAAEKALPARQPPRFWQSVESQNRAQLDPAAP
ncbi:MAG TPA: amidase [Rhizomicrobium sp.]|nr:amidase [Rhizomicrobium sp.]